MINNNSGNKNKKKNTNDQINVYFFNTNTGQCIFFIDLFYH